MIMICGGREVVIKRARGGYIRREMEKRLKRAGVSPHDIKLACDFIEAAKERDKKIAKEIEENRNNDRRN